LHIADRNRERLKRFADGRGLCPSGLRKPALGLAPGEVGRFVGRADVLGRSVPNEDDIAAFAQLRQQRAQVRGFRLGGARQKRQEPGSRRERKRCGTQCQDGSTPMDGFHGGASRSMSAARRAACFQAAAISPHH
jgi:hypothetical protein